MGIRHQVYVQFEEKRKKTSSGPIELTGIHIQVCDGYDALQLLCNLLDFNQHNNGYALSLCTDTFETNFHLFDKQLTIAEKLLVSLYSVCPETGFYSMGTSLLSDNTLKNPERGDNNSGITVIDLRGDVKYCFMRLKQSELALESFVPYQPIKAVDYINALRYIEEQSAYKSDPIWDEQHKLKLLDKISTVNLLALSECQQLFPSLYK